MFKVTDDLRIADLRPLIPPAILMEQFPISETASNTVTAAREHAARIIEGGDDRLLVVAGPCSIHDPTAALEYGSRLKEQALRLGKRTVHSHAGILRETSHDRRLERVDQRSAIGRQFCHQ